MSVLTLAKKHVWTIYVLAAFLLVLRAPDRYLTPQLWAEDGRVFLTESLSAGWVSLFKPYAGYLHFYLRLVALPTPVIPMEWIPAFYYCGAIVLVLFGMRLIHSSRIDLPAKPLLALCLPLIPFPGAAFLNLTNAQWFLAPALPFLLLQPSAETKKKAVWDALLILTLGLTGPFLVLWLPLLALRLKLRGFHRMDIPLYMGAITACAVQVFTFLTSERVPPPGRMNTESHEAVNAILALVFRPLSTLFMGDLSDHITLISNALTLGLGPFAPGAIWRLPLFLPAISGVLGLLLGAYALSAIWRLPHPQRLLCVGFVSAGIAVLVVGYFAGGPVWQSLMKPGGVGERYYMPLFALVMQVSVIITFSSWPIGRWLLIPIALAVISSFKVPPLDDYLWKHQIQSAVTDPGNSRIKIHPTPIWDISVTPVDALNRLPVFARDFIVRQSEPPTEKRSP